MISKKYLFLLFPLLIVSFFPSKIEAAVCDSNGCWTSVNCPNGSFTLYCTQNCNCPSSPCTDGRGNCVPGTAISEAGCDQNGNGYIICTGCTCAGGGGGFVSTPTPTPTPCSNPPAPTLDFPSDKSVFNIIAKDDLYIDLKLNPVNGSCGGNKPQYKIWFGNEVGGNYEKDWGELTWHTGPYNNSHIWTWKGKTRWYDSYYGVWRESDWSDARTYYTLSCLVDIRTGVSLVQHEDVLKEDGKYNKLIYWTADIPSAEGYKIYLCQTTLSDSCTPTYLTTLPPNATSYTATNNNQGFSPGTKVIYEVRPYRLGGADLNCPDIINDFPNLEISPSLTPSPILISTPTPTPTPSPTILRPTPTPTLTPSASFLRDWYQTSEGDVYSGGDLIVHLPEGNYFSLKGKSISPGLISSLNRNPFFGQGEISEKEWLVVGFKNEKVYDYSYFDTLLDILSKNNIQVNSQFAVLNGETIGDQNIKDSVYWRINGNLEVENIDDNLGVKVFLIKGKLIFKRDIDLQNTTPVFITNGGVEISPQVHVLRIILISDGEIKTGQTKENQSLEIKGMAISWQDFSLEREREDVSKPAEIFSYQPEMFLKIIPYLSWRFHVWEELVP